MNQQVYVEKGLRFQVHPTFGNCHQIKPGSEPKGELFPIVLNFAIALASFTHEKPLLPPPAGTVVCRFFLVVLLKNG